MADSIVETYVAALATTDALVKEVDSLRRIIEVCALRSGGRLMIMGAELLTTTGEVSVWCDKLTGVLHVSAEESPGEEGQH